MQRFRFLEKLIFGYFNQDANIKNDVEDTIEGIVRRFKTSALKWIFKDLIEEVGDFIFSYGYEVEEEL